MVSSEESLFQLLSFPYPAVVLLGPTGSGKTPLGNRMASQGLWGRACVHFDFGQQLRLLADPENFAEQQEHGAVPPCPTETEQDRQTEDFRRELHFLRSRCADFFTQEERQFVREVLRTGALLEDEHFPIALKILKLFLIFQVARPETVPPPTGEKSTRLTLEQQGATKSRKATSQETPAETLIVLNGLPRHVGQAEALQPWMDVQAVIHLDCPAEVVLERIRTNVGGDRGDRIDDDLGAIRSRLATYRARTQPLIDYYQSRGVPIVRLEVTAGMSPAEAWEELRGRCPWR